MASPSDERVRIRVHRQRLPGDVAADGEARNTMALAMSSAETSRRSDVLASASSRTTSGGDPARGRLVREDLVDARARDRARADRVDAHAEGSELDRRAISSTR